MLSGFESVSIDTRNIDVAHLPPLRTPVLKMGVDRLVGLDLYARAIR
jgi:hypothetical protein